MTDPWTPELVKDRLAAATDVLRRLRVPGIQRRVTYWPEWMRAWKSVMAETRAPDPTEAPPGGQEIDDMDEALVWLSWLDRREQQVVWARACLVQWWKISGKMRRSERTLKTVYDAAIDKIVERLNSGVEPKTEALQAGL